MSYANHLKETQGIAGGVGSLDEGLSQAALERPAAFLHHISVMQDGIQAMDRHYSDMQEACSSMSHHCTSVQKNCGWPIKKGVTLFGNVLSQLRLIKNRLDEEPGIMESALKKIVDKQPA